MNNHEEKLSLIQDLIGLSLADGNEDFNEGNFIYTIANSLGVSELEVSALKNTPVKYSPADKETDRIIQFYRLLLLMGVDQKKTDSEIAFCKEVALKMGLNPIAVNDTIKSILESETGMMSPEDVIKIFQIQHN